MQVWISNGSKKPRHVTFCVEDFPTKESFRRFLADNFGIASDSCVRIRNPDGALVVAHPRSFGSSSRTSPYRIEMITPVTNKSTSIAAQDYRHGQLDDYTSCVKLENIQKRLLKLESILEQQENNSPAHELLLNIQSRLAFIERTLNSLPRIDVEDMTENHFENFQSPFW